MKVYEEQKLNHDIITVTEKSSEQSKKWRNEGNKIFLKNPTDELVLELYNKSIAYAPKGSVELSIAHSHQSALLYNLRKYVECVQAIESCLSVNNYPEHFKLKIFLRKTECLSRLNKKNQGKKSLQRN